MSEAQGARPAVQERSRKTRDDLLDALDRLLRRKDFADISVAEVAEKAGVSPASIYRRFEGGLTEVLFALTRAKIEANVRDADADTDIPSSKNLREALRKTSLAAWRQLTTDAHVFRAAYMHARLRPDLVEPRPDLEERSLTGFRMVLDRHRKEIKRKDLNRAALTIAMLYNTAFLERALFPDRLPRWSKDANETYTNEVAELAYGYLTTKDP